MSQKLRERFVDLLSWLGKLVAGPRGRPQTGCQTEQVLELGELFEKASLSRFYLNLRVWLSPGKE